MYTTTDTARPGGIRNALRRVESWIDQFGKVGWFATAILAFLAFPPLGLGVLAYMIWGKQMFARSCGHRRHHNHSHADDHSWGRHAMRAAQPTGNRAFDSYKAEALRRLEEEQEAFEAFLQRLRTSKDKTEFDSFMEDRARATAAGDVSETEVRPEPKPDQGSRAGEY
jgi:Protein of unknown function (DUF2852)